MRFPDYLNPKPRTSWVVSLRKTTPVTLPERASESEEAH